MPEKLEKELRKKALLKKLTGENADAHVYGTIVYDTMRKTGWKPKREKPSGN